MDRFTDQEYIEDICDGEYKVLSIKKFSIES